MIDLLSDLRYACRALRAAPGVAAISILTLALAIGANTAIFTVTHAVVLRPLPFAEPDRLVALWETHPSIGKQEVAAPDFADWRDRMRSFDGMAAFTMPGHLKLSLSGGGAEPEQLQGTLASHNLFPLLGIQPLRGRTFVAADDEAGRNQVALISHALWQRRFGADPAIVGRAIVLNGEPFHVIGVLPPRVQVPDWAEVWLPLSRLEPLARQQRQWHSLHAIGRMKAGVTLAQADADLQHVVAQLRRDHPVTNGPTGGMLVPLQTEYLGHVRLAWLLVTVAVGLVLLIACANVAHLTVARSVARRREIAVRAALGATRVRIVRLLLMEAFVTSAIAGALGIAIAAGGVHVLRLAAADVLVRAGEIRLDVVTLIAAALLCAVTTIAASLLPALRTSRAGAALPEALKDGDRTSAGGRTRRLHAVLVAGEIALTLVVLVSGGLLAESFRRLVSVEPGFDTARLLSARVALVRSRWPSGAHVRQFHEDLAARVSALPGVVATATVDTAPLTASGSRFAVWGQPEPPAGRFPVAQVRFVSPDYFAAMGIPLVDGRPFDRGDVGSSRIIVNRALARRFLLTDAAAGRSLMTGLFRPQRHELPIVGVAGDIQELGLDVPAEPTMYYCDYRATSTVMVRTGVPAESLIAPLRAAVRDLDPDQPIFDARSMDDLYARTLARRRFLLALFGLFGMLAVTLAVAGVFGVVSRAVTERTREVGLRIALGAAPRDVALLIVRQHLAPIAVGLAIGTSLAAALSHAARTLLFGVGAYDVTTYAAANLLLFGVSAGVACLAALRVLRVDPAVAIRRAG